MSKVPENTLDILERNIQKLKDSEEPLSLADLKRLETLVNIRRIMILNGADDGRDNERHPDVTDEEILFELRKPVEKLKIPRKPRGKKATDKKRVS